MANNMVLDAKRLYLSKETKSSFVKSNFAVNNVNLFFHSPQYWQRLHFDDKQVLLWGIIPYFSVF